MKFLSSLVVIIIFAFVVIKVPYYSESISFRVRQQRSDNNKAETTTTDEQRVVASAESLADGKKKEEAPEIITTTEKEVVWIISDRETIVSSKDFFHMDRWNEEQLLPNATLVRVTAAVSRDERERLESLEGVVSVETNEDLDKRVRNLGTLAQGQTGGIPGYPCYRTVEETYETARSIAAGFPHIASWIDIGDSIDKTQGNGGHDLYALVLTNNNNSEETPRPKPVFFASFAIHSREYATAELGTRFAEMLVDGYGTDAGITWLLDFHEVHLVLQANPDGRREAEKGELWRKNTNPDYCADDHDRRGADLNRNFAYMWDCCGGASDNPCHNDYRGPSAASEPEVKAIQEYVRRIFPPPQRSGTSVLDASPPNATGIAIDVHSYGGSILFPWSHTFDRSPNHDELQTLGRKLAFFNDHDALPSGAGLYPSDGDSADFFYGDLGVAGFTYEIGTSFFEDCASFETDVLNKNTQSLLHAAMLARSPFQTPSGPDARDVEVTAAGGTSAVVVTATIDDTRYNGREPTQEIASANVFVDVPPWEDGANPLPMTAADGEFGRRSVEDVAVTIDISNLSVGTHLLYVQGTDTDNNVGLVGAVFLEIGDDNEEIDINNDNEEINNNDNEEINNNNEEINNNNDEEINNNNEEIDNNEVEESSSSSSSNAGDEVSEEPQALCNDDPVGWYDADGPLYDCDWYGTSYNNHCDLYGDAAPNFGGRTANEACCACGGGSGNNNNGGGGGNTVGGDGGSGGSNSGGECIDVVGWSDSYGDGCDWYGRGNNCQWFGDAFSNSEGYTASDACCVCGGGKGGR